MIKRYFDPETPYARALAHPSIDAAIKVRMCETHAKLDPIALLAEIRAAQDELGHRVDRRAGACVAGAAWTVASPVVFAADFGKNLDQGEQRTIHRRR